jgi:DNA-binding NarL/FixJ family response regulator
VKHFPGFPVPQDGNKLSILVLDTVSVREWEAILLRWKSSGGHVIALVSPHAGGNDNVRGIYLGAKGTVQMSPKLSEELPRAIRTAATEGIWISPGILTDYVNAANSLMRQISSPNHRLTQREEEVLALLMTGDSNKEIGNSLGISERTAKFHVSSILRKVEIKSRRELIRKVRSGTLSYLDVIRYRNKTKAFFPDSEKTA